MIDRFSPTLRNAALFAVFLLVGWFLWSVRSVLNPLILAYLLAFVAHPLVLRLERRGWRRRRAVNFIFGAFAVLLVLVAFGIYFQGRGLARELTREDGLGLKVRERVEQAIEEYQDEIAWTLQFVPDSKLHATKEGAATTGTAPRSDTPPKPDATPKPDTQSSPPSAPSDSTAKPEAGVSSKKPASPATAKKIEDLKIFLREWWDTFLAKDGGGQAADFGGKLGAGLLYLLSEVFGNLLSLGGLLLLLPIYTYFLLFELERIHRFVARYLPARDRERYVQIGTQIGEVLANFFRGRLLVCLAKGTFLAIGLSMAGVDFALLLGLGTGFLSLIPFVGSLAGFVMALLVALLEHSLVGSLVRVGIVFGMAEMLENYVLIPKIIGDSLGLHPIIVIFSLMAGAASLGMFGLLVALPLTATLVILGREFLLPVLAQLADEGSSPPKPRKSG
jgi:predicted PurR-regulated permease PerM